MQTLFSSRRNSVITILFLAGFVAFLFFVFREKEPPEVLVENKVESNGPVHIVIGKSVENRDIYAYSYGNGPTKLAFVGGIHGGYEWNSSVLAYKFMDYFVANPELIPKNLTVIIIPAANPDGIYKIVGKEGIFTDLDVPSGTNSAGRFNANKVDLNRNFDCKWKPESTWQQKTVSAGKTPFSEPETVAIKKFVEENNPKAVIFWHSQGNAVYASQCEQGIIPETLNIMNVYSKASGYPADPTFDAYETTGDADAWLAKIGIPSITVELKTHDSIDWEQNLAGVKALFEYYK